mgnify:CR=1 FL=1
MQSDPGSKVTPVSNLTEFFRDALDKALLHQHVSLDAHTAHYVVSLLTLYSRTEVSHGDTRPGQRWAWFGTAVAAVKAVSVTEIARQTSANATAFYGISLHPDRTMFA